MVIERDWRALIGTACWSIIVAWIPLPFKAISIAQTSYRFDGVDTLTYTHGLIRRVDENIDLRRARSINASDSPFSGGSLIIASTDGVRVLPYVRNARSRGGDAQACGGRAKPRAR